jgi:hypothetical protein
MFDWETKNYERLVPRIAFLIDGILEHSGPGTLLAPYSAFVLRRDYNVVWEGGENPHALKPDEELAVAYLHECDNYEDLKKTLRLAPVFAALSAQIVLKREVDVTSTELGLILKQRANAPDINL